MSRILASPVATSAMAAVAHGYIELVRRTSTTLHDPPDLMSRLSQLTPAVFVTWHGQTALAPFILDGKARYTILAAQHRDGAWIASLCARLGVDVVRGSHAKQGRGQSITQAVPIRQLVRSISSGSSIFLTADAPKLARVARAGAIMIASLTDRPIIPFAAVTNRRFDLDTWDHASIPKPFGRCCIAIGAPIHIPPRSQNSDLEGHLPALSHAIDRVHDLAFARVESFDPGRMVPGIGS